MTNCRLEKHKAAREAKLCGKLGVNVSDENLQLTKATIHKSSFLSRTMARARENPWTVVFGAISFFLAVYAIYDAKNEPDLQIVFDPATATKIVTELTPDIEVRYKGTLVPGEVSSQVIRFWNAGKRPIESQDVLTQLQIKAAEGVTILDVRIKQQSRDVVAVAPTVVDKSTVRLTWRILENDDGAAIQLIYQGSSDAKFTIKGAVRGQKAISVNYLSRTKPEPSELQMMLHKMAQGWSPWARLAAALVSAVVVLIATLALVYCLIYFFTNYFTKWFPGAEAPGLGWMFLFVFLMLAAMIAVALGPIGALGISVPAAIR